MGTSHRSQKVADRIKVVVAGLLEGKIKDPRLGFVTVTDARVTGDLQHASIFYTVLGDDEQRESTAAALESAKGVIRSAVGKDLGVRVTPSNTPIATTRLLMFIFCHFNSLERKLRWAWRRLLDFQVKQLIRWKMKSQHKYQLMVMPKSCVRMRVPVLLLY